MNGERIRNKPIETRQTNYATLGYRGVFATEIYFAHQKLVQRWVRRLVPESLRESIDSDQLQLLILHELIDRLRNRVCEVDIDRNETITLCWTNANHQAINAVRNARRLKRNCPSELERELVEVQPDRKDCNRPDIVVEFNDFRSVILGCLEPIKRRVVELKILDWTHREIADELGVSLTALKVMRKEIADTTRRIIEKSNRPAINQSLSAVNKEQRTIARIDRLVSTILKKFRFFPSDASAFGALLS